MMNKKIFFMLVLFSLSFSQNCPPPTDDCVSNITNIILCEQGGNIILAFMLMTMLVSSAYIIGRFLGDARFITWSKDELYHLLFSAVLLIIFGGILSFSCIMMDSFFTLSMESMDGDYTCYQPGQPISQVSSCYLSLMKSRSERVAQHHINEYIENNLEATFTGSVSLPLLDTYTLTAGAFRIIHARQHDFIVNTFLVPAILSISMQKIFLDLITENVLVWVVPSAFILRILSPTRQFGNILFVLSIGLYVLVPFMFTFNLAMYDMVSDECTASPPAGPSIAEATCDLVFDGECSEPSVVCENPYSLWFIAKIIPQAFFLPNLVIAVVITFVTAGEKALRVIG